MQAGSILQKWEWERTANTEVKSVKMLETTAITTFQMNFYFSCMYQTLNQSTFSFDPSLLKVKLITIIFRKYCQQSDLYLQ